MGGGYAHPRRTVGVGLGDRAYLLVWTGCGGASGWRVEDKLGCIIL
jgi:hypothetical protein